jgi:hypothetical protein
MDSPTVGSTVRALVTDGNGAFYESTYVIPEINDGDILVKAAMTGVCRSDIAMMQGDFQLLPASMHGHEGLGINVATGEYVATRGEPAYADYYVARKGTYVTVPELDPKYIIEPVACGVNIILNSLDEFKKRDGGRLCIIGTGFLAKVVHQTLTNLDLHFDIDVVGSSNIKYWHLLLHKPADCEYDVIIDLSEHNTLRQANVAENALIIMAAEKLSAYTTTFGNWLWKNVTMCFPSPRSEKFLPSMKLAVTHIESGKLNVDNTWTCGYNRNTEWKQAFADAVNRPAGYNRGYIKWD